MSFVEDGYLNEILSDDYLLDRTQVAETKNGYTLIEEPLRIDAIDDEGVAICGAYQPLGHDYWCFFVTQTVTRVTGLTTPPHKEHFHGELGRVHVRRWVELLACLTVMALKGQKR